MELKENVKESILKAISEIGAEGATITQIEKKVDFERHTLSKYLSWMQAHGLIYYRLYGKAKVWFINKAPIQTILNSLPEKKTFTEKILSDIISSLPYGLVIINKDYDIMFMNQKIMDTYGSLEGQKFYSAIIGKENPLTLKPIIDIMWGKSDKAKFETRDKDGRILVMNATKLVNPDKSLSIMMMVADVTERRKAEESLKERNAILESQWDTLSKSSIYSETDLDGIITNVNEKFCEISGYKKNELIGKKHSITNSGHHPKKFFKEMWDTIKSGRIWSGRIKNKRKNGSFYWVNSVIAPVFGKNGMPVKYISIRFDVTGFKDSKKK